MNALKERIVVEDDAPSARVFLSAIRAVIRMDAMLFVGGENRPCNE